MTHRDSKLTLSEDPALNDPFARGIQFNAKFVGHTEVKSQRYNETFRKKLVEIIQTAKGSPQEVVFVVKSNTLRIKYLTQNSTVDYLISRVMYCGAHTDFKDRFFFIHRSKRDRSLIAQIYWLSSSDKVKALTLTIAKAFQISYMGWISDMSRNRDDKTLIKSEETSGHGNRDNETPSETLETSGPTKGRARSVPPGVLTKSRDPVRRARIVRRHSYGDESEPPTHIPAVYKAQAKNRQTGSIHDVSLTVDMNIDFRELAEACSTPDILSTDLSPQEVNQFNLSSIREYIDY